MSNLTQYTEEVVNEFVGAGREFSHYDVTREIRNRVNTKVVELDDRPAEDIDLRNGTKALTQNIPHQEVRAAILTMFSTIGFNGYERTTRGDHWLYKPATVSSEIAVEDEDAADEDDEDEDA